MSYVYFRHAVALSKSKSVWRVGFLSAVFGLVATTLLLTSRGNHRLYVEQDTTHHELRLAEELEFGGKPHVAQQRFRQVDAEHQMDTLPNNLQVPTTTSPTIDVKNIPRGRYLDFPSGPAPESTPAAIQPGKNEAEKRPTPVSLPAIAAGIIVKDRQLSHGSNKELGGPHSQEILNSATMLYSLLNGSMTPFAPGHNVPSYVDIFRSRPPKPVSPKAVEPITVYVIPHSHNDPGWLQTFEDYYTGSTSAILDTVVAGLVQYPDWKFIWSEMSFLNRWWEDQAEDRRAVFRDLVRSGRLELTTGGWVMPDEANTHYYAVLDQLIEGHSWIREHIDPTWEPVSSWSNDPFGYSSSVAHMYQQAGVKRMMILRVHYMLKFQLARKKALQFYWNQPWDTKAKAGIFTHMEPSALYSTKHSCGPSEAICCNFDFFYLNFCQYQSQCDCIVEQITNQNVRLKAADLLQQARSKAELFRTNTVAILNGDDFRYNKPDEVTAQYENFKLLMNYINSNRDFQATVKFGTLKEFLETAQQDKTVRYPRLHGDFFPYTDTGTEYWTGYFTSRPHHKRIGRAVQSALYTADLLFALANARNLRVSGLYENLTLARHEFNLFQHHDAVTGTSTEFVMADYLKRLLWSYTALSNITSTLLQHLSSIPMLCSTVAIDPIYASPQIQVLRVRNQGSLLVAYNALPRSDKRLVRFLVNSPYISLSTCTGHRVPFQVNRILGTSFHSNSSTDSYEVLFDAALPALGYGVYAVQATRPRRSLSYLARETFHVPQGSSALPPHSLTHMPSSTIQIKRPFSVGTDHFSTSFSSDGLLVGIRMLGKAIPLRLDFIVYNEVANRGGAYIFEPAANASRVPGAAYYVRVVSGPLCHTITSYWSFFNHTVRVCNSSFGNASAGNLSNVRISIENSVDLKTYSQYDIDFGMRISSTIRSKDLFYTDLNSLQMAQRRRFPGKISANFYPMTSLAYIEDRQQRLSLHTAQPLGVSSLRSGMLEVILDRYMIADDGRGPVGGTMDCSERSLSTFDLVLEKKLPASRVWHRPGVPSLQAHRVSERLLHPVQVFVSPARHANTGVCQHGLLRRQLPCDIQLVALRPMTAARSIQTVVTLHRVAFDHVQFTSTRLHGCPQQSADKRISFYKLFTGLDVVDIKNTSLTCLYHRNSIRPASSFKLSPRELSSFLVKLRPNR